MPGADWLGTVHHGLPLELYQPNFGRGEYLAFLGRICPEKRADRAIEIARRVGLPLKIAAKVDRADYDYYRRKIKPLIEGSDVEFVGEINGAAKNEFLGKARALLFPIDWPEPFGLVMIEAMACGLPVVAWPCGSVPEVIEDGVSGFIVDSVDAAVRAVETIDSVSRETCRATFETRFSARRMAEDYVDLYQKVMAHGRIDETTVMGGLRAEPAQSPSTRRDRTPCGSSAEISRRPSEVEGPAAGIITRDWLRAIRPTWSS